MSERSKSSKGKAALDPARPFDPAILARARVIADRYRIVLEREDDWWYGHGLEMPGAGGDGATVEAAVADTREALVTVVATMLEKGERPPAPASTGRRTEQINVRLTAEERLHLENRSQVQGFRGLSDYVRAAALAEPQTIAPATPAAMTGTRGRSRKRCAAGKTQPRPSR
jgi:predicted RNase H-like HicB family nuclease